MSDKQIILPKTEARIVYCPIIFLFGPIRGAPTYWHDEAIELIFSKLNQVTVICPKRWVKEELIKYVLGEKTSTFTRQRPWERYYIDKAFESGAGMFWLPGEVQHSCGKAYGAMTRLELGQVLTRYKNDSSTRFSIGSDGKFSELDTIKCDLVLDAPSKKIHKTLEETVDEAVELALSNPHA